MRLPSRAAPPIGVRPVRLWKIMPLVTFACVAAFAQVTGSISGKVVDATNTPVGGADIQVKSAETGAVRTATTDESGNYKVLSLPLGLQEVRIEKNGFKAAVRDRIDLTVGQEA